MRLNGVAQSDNHKDEKMQEHIGPRAERATENKGPDSICMVVPAAAGAEHATKIGTAEKMLIRGKKRRAK